MTMPATEADLLYVVGAMLDYQDRINTLLRTWLFAGHGGGGGGVGGGGVAAGATPMAEGAAAGATAPAVEAAAEAGHSGRL